MAFLVGLLHDIGKLAHHADPPPQLCGVRWRPPLVFPTTSPSGTRIPGLRSRGAGRACSGQMGACPIPCPRSWPAPPTRARLSGRRPVAVLVAVLRIADVIDTLVSSDKADRRCRPQRLADGPDAIAAAFAKKTSWPQSPRRPRFAMRPSCFSLGRRTDGHGLHQQFHLRQRPTRDCQR